MIYFNKNDECIMEGTEVELLTEVGIMSVYLIQQMITCGMSKSKAITTFYKALESSIKLYESKGKL